MILTLMWLTVSAPYVLACRQLMTGQVTGSFDNFPDTSGEEDTTNPFGNNTEEKVPGSNNLSEEYLHDQQEHAYSFLLRTTRRMNEKAATYVAFHGELLVPPPNQA